MSRGGVARNVNVPFADEITAEVRGHCVFHIGDQRLQSWHRQSAADGTDTDDDCALHPDRAATDGYTKRRHDADWCDSADYV